MDKKILIVGPIGDFGGRDVEVNIIANALEEITVVTVLSTIYMSKKSFSIQDLRNTKWTSIEKQLYKKNIFLRVLSKISKYFNRGNKLAYGYINNSLSKKIFNLNAHYAQILSTQIIKANVVIVCAQLSTRYLKEIVECSKLNNIPVMVRTTGTIRDISASKANFLKQVNLFIHHSEANAQNLNKQIPLPYTIIDQCAILEHQLLNIPIHFKEPLRYGYLGRLSEEKGVIPITKYFLGNNNPFIIAGDGAQKKELLKLIDQQSNIEYIGLVKSDEIADFFKKIDILIISSYEESGPLVGLEAMAAGKIIISTNVGAMEERLQKNDNSFWFKIENIDSFDYCVKQINDLSLDNLTLLGSNLRKIYLKKYTKSHIKAVYQNTIKQFLA